MSASHYGNAVGRTEPSHWVIGLAVFAGALMIAVGIFQVIAGTVALFQNEIYVVGQQYAVSFDVTTWGWIHLLVGILVTAAGLAVLTGQLWGRVVGIALAVLSMIANFMFMPYYPFWALAIIALDVFVIWALCSFDREAARR
jgi:hypothetical protein